MGDSYRDYIKGRRKNTGRARNEVASETVARTAAIQEQERKKAAKTSQYKMRLLNAKE